jgi:diacylglycerol kinase
MQEKSKFSVSARLKSFGYAWKGISGTLIYQHNFRIQLVAALLVILAGFLFSISAAEWLVVFITIALVLSLEAINTAIEHLVDHLSKERSTEAGRIKDLAAGAVLISSIFAVIIALIIFIPKILKL